MSDDEDVIGVPRTAVFPASASFNSASDGFRVGLAPADWLTITIALYAVVAIWEVI